MRKDLGRERACARLHTVGTGGRQVRTGPEYGNIYDHHSVTYEYANGVKLFSTCRQQRGCHNDMSAHVLGEKGYALVSERRLAISAGDKEWVFKAPDDNQDDNMYQKEDDKLFAAVRSGKPINNGEYMSYSTLLAIMGRMAAYTGQEVTWKMALESKEDLSPPKYDFDVKLAHPPVAIPGVTAFS